MSASPYDGYARTCPRVTLAVCAAVDAGALAWALCHASRNAQTHPRAPAFLLALASSPGRVVPLALLAVGAAFAFARGPARALPGAVVLGVLALFVEAHAALVGGPMRVFFTTGAALLGWLAGLGYAAALGLPAPRDADTARRRESLAEAGAVGGIAATYLGAAVSKLAASGWAWTEPSGLRALVFAQQPLGTPAVLRAYAFALAEHAWLARTLALLTVVIQGGALVYLAGPRWRALWGTLLLAFHVDVYLLTPILFPQAMALLVAFSYPWPRWLGRARGAAVERERVPAPRARRTAAWAMLVVLALVALAVVAPVRGYTSLHHHEAGRPANGAPRGPAPPPRATADVIAQLGGLAPGSTLVHGWRVAAVHGAFETAVQLDLVAPGDMAALQVLVARHGALHFTPPRSVPGYDVFYAPMPGRPAPDDAMRDALLDAVAARVGVTR